MGSLHHLDGRDTMVSDLESVLERAKAGQFTALAIAATMADGVAVMTYWNLGSKGNLWTLIGALRTVEARILDGVGHLEYHTPPEPDDVPTG